MTEERTTISVRRSTYELLKSKGKFQESFDKLLQRLAGDLESPSQASRVEQD